MYQKLRIVKLLNCSQAIKGGSCLQQFSNLAINLVSKKCYTKIDTNLHII